MNQAWPFPAPFDLTGTTVLSGARQRTLRLLVQISERLAPLATAAPTVATVAVSGSLGRLEALPHSDCDLLVVSGAAPEPKDAAFDNAAAVDEAWSLLDPLGFPRPEAGGIFSSAVSSAKLCSPSALGSLNEAKSVFGKRIQLLLDCRPVYCADRFYSLLRRILEWYARGYLEHDPGKQWTYLLNDLSRYLHSYSAWKQFDFGAGEGESWYTLQLKLRTSRLLAFAGLLLLLGHSSNVEDDKIAWLHQRLSLSPLERVALAFEAYQDRGFTHIVDAYEQFMAAMNDAETRNHLLARSPTSVADFARPFDPLYLELHRLTGSIAAELTRFVLDRRADWHPRFFQYYLF